MLGCSAYGAGRDPLDGSSGGHPAATAASDTLCCRLPAATADTATLLRLWENKANRRSELVAPPGSGCRGLLVDHREVLACAGAGFRYPGMMVEDAEFAAHPVEPLAQLGLKRYIARHLYRALTTAMTPAPASPAQPTPRRA